MLTAVLLLASKPVRFEHTRGAAILLGLKPELISGNQTRPIRSTYLSEEVLRRLPCCLKRKLARAPTFIQLLATNKTGLPICRPPDS